MTLIVFSCTGCFTWQHKISQNIKSILQETLAVMFLVSHDRIYACRYAKITKRIVGSSWTGNLYLLCSVNFAMLNEIVPEAPSNFSLHGTRRCRRVP